MSKFSTELINKLTEFLVCEIQSKALSGITYTMLLKGENQEAFDRYYSIKNEAAKCGYSSDEVFRVYEVSNGYIFDMDIKVAKKISYELTKAVAKANGGETPVGDLIGDNPNKRRKDDMVSLAKYVKNQFDDGKQEVDVALFSRNSVPRIIITCVGPNGESMPVKYNSYAIRHWDIEAVNSNLLIPSGLRISKIKPMEILPSRTGVRFKLYIESIKQ